MINRPTLSNKNFEFIGLWSIEFELVGLLNWAQFNRPNRSSVKNSLKIK